ncbi:cell division protein ZapC [Enterovibrio nigricans]|uniref:Cell division protein ZapC n=1 Tax=Enterovibrio nigricans DSM 22720 TaxID=1121868 RepID=A0A1T4ULQ5_9GAMM|nr:cell division protein ZapC [Enterovibrio nigricans]SKA53530.1 cell division protein ZapC [Enterovibrio nigricans DSM 22720]
MLKPNNAWKWYFDKEAQLLMLDLGEDMVFRVAMEKKHLIPDAFVDTPFSVDDASLFQVYNEALSVLPLSSPRRAELVLNAVAANRFHKPLLPKSWFFKSIEGHVTPAAGSIVELQTDFGSEAYLVIENSGCASLCMHAGESPLALSESKQMRFCEAIKVMNDRLSIYEEQYDSGSGQYALVG